MNYDPSTLVLDRAAQQSQTQTPAPSGGYDPSTLVLDRPNNSDSSQSSGIVNDIKNSKGNIFYPTDNNLDKTLAAGSSAQNTMAGMVGTATGNPNITKALSAPSFTDQARQDNPGFAIAGMIGGATLAAGTVLATAAAGAAALGTTGLLTDVAANGIAGSVLAGPDNRLKGGITGVVTAGLSSAISSTTNYVAQTALVKGAITSTVSKINSLIDGTPGEVASKSQANMWKATSAVEDTMSKTFQDSTATTIPTNVSKQAQTILDKYDDPKQLGQLTGEQRGIIEQIRDWGKPNTQQVPGSSLLDSSGNQINPASIKQTPPDSFSFNDLHTARKELDQAISQAFNKADNGEISRGLAQSLKSLREPMIQDLQNAAKAAGKLPEYRAFNEFYQSQVLPLINAGAKDTYTTLNNTVTLSKDTMIGGQMVKAGTAVNKDPMAVANLTDNLISKNMKVNKPEAAKAFLNTLDPTGQNAIGAAMVQNVVKSATSKAGEVDPVVVQAGLQKMLKSFPDAFSDNTKNLVNGLNNTIDEATTILGHQVGSGGLRKIAATAAATGVVGSAGAGIGYSQGGSSGAWEGGIAAIAMTLGLNKLISSPSGQAVLRQVATPGGKAVGKTIVQSILLNGALGYEKAARGNQ